MRDRTREVTALELALWHRAVRDVLRSAERKATPEPPAAPAVAAPDAPAEEPDPAQKPPAAAPAAGLRPAPRPPRPVPLDRRMRRRLDRGHFPLGARLDLHGLTQEAAHAALTRFLPRAAEAGHRCVLVITGRGERSGGILRTAVPRWLAEPPLAEKVLGWAEAGRSHGGRGALYVLLRRSDASREKR